MARAGQLGQDSQDGKIGDDGQNITEMAEQYANPALDPKNMKY
jgi:hypothetical protein